MKTYNEFKEEIADEESFENMNDDEMFLGSNNGQSNEFEDEYL